MLLRKRVSKTLTLESWQWCEYAHMKFSTGIVQGNK